MNIRASIKRVAAERMIVEGLIADNTVRKVLQVAAGVKTVWIDAKGKTLEITAVDADALWEAYRLDLEEEGISAHMKGRELRSGIREVTIRRVAQYSVIALTRAFRLNFKLSEPIDVAEFEKSHNLVFEAEFKPEDADRILLTF